jgi:hypothetical protein
MKTLYTFILLMAAIILIYSCNHEIVEPGTGKLFPQVRIIIADNCTITCHAPSRGLDEGRPVSLESDSDLVGLAPVIKSAVADPVSPTNIRMPQGGSLSPAEIDTIVKWAEKGGKATD